MPKNPDQVLSAVTEDPEREPDIELAEAPDPDPATFDIHAAAHGVRATRIRVSIHPGAHLLARVQELAEKIDSYPTDDDVPEDVIADWQETWEEFDRRDVYVLEGRSSDWIKDFTRQAKAKGVNPSRKGLSDEEQTEHLIRQTHMQIAAQIVQPEGATEDDVAAIFAGNEAEGNKLFRAMQQVNTQPVKGLVPDFSPRVSRLSRTGSA